MVTVADAEVPLHAPDQPPKTKPWAGTAVSVTEVPSRYLVVQAGPQSRPAGRCQDHSSFSSEEGPSEKILCARLIPPMMSAKSTIPNGSE